MTTVTDVSLGITGNGSDETTTLQNAVNTATTAGETLLITKDIRINDQGILMPDNAKVIFDRFARLKLLPTSVVNYDLIMCMGNNITLWNPKVDGSNETNSASTGASRIGMGIAIAGGSNVTIYNPEVWNCWGDGIYIRGSYTGANTPPTNIKIVGARVYNCGRDAVSVVSANGLLLSDLYGQNHTTADPAALIDFEPNVNGDVLQNITVSGAKSVNNTNGLRFSFQNLPGANPQNVSIAIDNFEDYGSTGRALYWLALTAGNYSMSGNITLINPKFHGSATQMWNTSWDNSVPVLITR